MIRCENMEIGVVVHGPGIVDSGWALEIINLLSKLGDVRCRLGGTMGRTAIIDARDVLYVRIDRTRKVTLTTLLRAFGLSSVIDLII